MHPISGKVRRWFGVSPSRTEQPVLLWRLAFGLVHSIGLACPQLRRED
ncbi:MAG TPA: hypothetical protein VFG81_09190 [Anaerolineales bacterium]|jgi:hypothetical protein|nr:hypothetical protein [Anaerolineales bacterium]